MFEYRHTNPKLLNRLVDFVVLGLTFYLSCLVLSIGSGNGLFFLALTYATIMLVFVQLCKKAIVSYKKSVSEITRQILGNAVGILIGTFIMLFLETLLLTDGELMVAIIFSSTMAFFILGTLSPIVHSKLSHSL